MRRIPISVTPTGFHRYPAGTHGLRHALHSCVASRLITCLVSVVGIVVLAQTVSAQNLQLMKTLTVPPEAAVHSVAITQKGDYVAAGCQDNQIRLWAFPSGELRQSFTFQDQKISGVWFSPDGALLAAGGNRGTVRIWGLPSGKLKAELKTGADVKALAISPDHTLVAVAPAEIPAQLWDLDIGRITADLTPKFAGSSAVAFSSDGQWLASADEDTVIRFYDGHTGASRASAQDLLLETFAIAFSADSKSLYAGGADKTISVIDVATGKISRTFPKQEFVVGGMDASRDGKSLVAAYFDANGFSNPAPVLEWDTASGSTQKTIQQPGFRPIGGGFLPDGRLLLASTAEGKLQIWRIR